MSEMSTICPYTGLRSFSEEESLYFKGRDLQIDQITDLLEQNRFLMVTGASGEGKSSLIYAGLIPNARSGFFKAKYTNWIVADFRPERSPVKSLSKSIADKFGSQPATVETELRRGYSSLLDLYTNSEFYIDEENENWKHLAEPEKKNKKRKAANLMILVDQFEEFFTNPENFYNEVPSLDSQIVVNLILETARIAIKQNLPVYIVCTMRSDYIGQCSAFRGLPEYIGFSQFFVPRLKRKDLKQVVEEPAILSGNRISQRLIERLVFDLSEGVDQLPILQHTLSQIWLTANQGREEMDLIHYARVGGMPVEELPDEDQIKFREWFNTIPDYQKNYYSTTGLNKVIEIHASVLYESAWVYYNQKNPNKSISQQDAKHIVALTFCCLTKIDNSRAVRNRMTLSEITEIINDSRFTSDVIGDVLNIYREEGNSFIRPFKTDDKETHSISNNTVLDITHESLIRNWTKLNEWANQEFEYYDTFLDFKKQIDRWKNNKKSSGYLLPIGPLTYFEKWYAECNPNIGWVKRYSEIHTDENKANQEARIVLADIKEFLKSSARNVLITRAFIKYGPQRIATILAIFIMFSLSGFYWYDASQKENSNVIEQVKHRAALLLKSKEISTESKAFYLLMEERYQKGTLYQNLEKIDSDNRLGIAIEAYRELLRIDKHSSMPVKSELINFIQSNLKESESVTGDFKLRLTQLNEFVILLSYDNYYNPNSVNRNLLTEFTEAGYKAVFDIFSYKKPVRSTFPVEMNVTIQWWLTFGKVTPDKVKGLLQLISPLQGDSATANFNVYYSKGNEEPNGRASNINNGGYHTLASLYASLGDAESVLWCFNQIKENGQNEYFGVGRQLNNYNNVLGYFYQYGFKEKVGPIIDWLAKNDQEDRPVSVYRNMIIRAGYISRFFPANIEKDYLRTYKGYFFPNLCLSEKNVYEAIAKDYEAELNKVSDKNERNFLWAMHYKRMAMHRHKYYFDRGLKIDYTTVNGWLEKSIEYFRLVDKNFLNEIVKITFPYYSDGVRTKNLSRQQLFIYPDYMDGWFSSTFHSDLFFNFLVNNNLLTEFFSSKEDLELITYWLAKANENKMIAFFPPPFFDNFYSLSDSTHIQINNFIRNHSAGSEVDLNYPAIILANRLFDQGDSLGGMRYVNQLDQKILIRTANRYEYVEKTFFLNQLKKLSGHLAVINKNELATILAEKFQEPTEKLFCYVYMAEVTYDARDPQFFVYLDSAMSITNKIDFGNVQFRLDARYNLMALLAKIGGKKMNDIAFEILREIPEGPKFEGIFRMSDGLAAEGNYYKAIAMIPSTLTEDEDLITCEIILWEECKKRDKELNENEWKMMDYRISGGWNYPIYFRPF